MKNRQIYATVLSVIVSISMIGCGKPKEIDNYPGMEPADLSVEESAVSEAGTVENVSYSDGKAFYTVRGQRGESVYSVEADIVGDPKDTYPVYDIKYFDLNQTDLYNISAFMIGARTANYLLPVELGDEDYLVNRLATLEERKEKLLSKGLEVNHAITSEMEAIQARLSDGSLNSAFTLPEPKLAQYIDLHDYYESEYGVDVDLQFSFAEGEAPDGNVYRFDAIKYKGNVTMKYYLVDYNYDDSNNFYLGSSESVLPVSFDKVKSTDCEELANHMLSELNIGGYTITKTLPACDYGAFKDGTEEHAYEKPAYCSFFSAEVNERVRPCNGATCFYSNNSTATRTAVSAGNIATIFAGGEEVYENESDLASGGNVGVYDSMSICVGEDDKIIEVLISNMLGDVQLRTEKPKLLPFEDVDLCAQKYLADQASKNTPEEAVTIDRVELGMCRVIGEKGNMFMVPAWYYFRKVSEVLPLPMPVMAINAIDGSVIDVMAGGTTITQ